MDISGMGYHAKVFRGNEGENSICAVFVEAPRFTLRPVVSPSVEEVVRRSGLVREYCTFYPENEEAEGFVSSSIDLLERSISLQGGHVDGGNDDAVEGWSEDEVVGEDSPRSGSDEIPMTRTTRHEAFYKEVFANGEIKQRLGYGSMRQGDPEAVLRVRDKDAARAYQQGNGYTGYLLFDSVDKIIGRVAVGSGWSLKDAEGCEDYSYRPAFSSEEDPQYTGSLPLEERVFELQMGDFVLFPEGAEYAEKKEIYRQALLATFVVARVLLEAGCKQNGVKPLCITITSLNPDSLDLSALEPEVQENARLKVEVIKDLGLKLLGALPHNDKRNASEHVRDVYGLGVDEFMEISESLIGSENLIVEHLEVAPQDSEI